MRRWVVLAGFAGLILIVVLVAVTDTHDLADTLARGGVGLLWASLFHIFPMIVSALAWQFLLPGASCGRWRNLWRLTFIVWVRESVNGLLPVARVGGDIASIRLLSKMGVGTTFAISSTIIDITISLISQFLFTLTGVVLLAERLGFNNYIWQIGLGVFILIPVVSIFIAVQKIGLFKLIKWLTNSFLRHKWHKLSTTVRQIDRTIATIYRLHWRLTACFILQFIAWILGSVELWLALQAFGYPVSLLDAFIIETMVQAISSAAFVIPSALGIQEAGFMLVGNMISISTPVSLALALARRVRDLILFIPGLAMWPLAENTSFLCKWRTKQAKLETLS